MPRKEYKFREVVKMLKAHDDKFEFYKKKGRGSHRTAYHPNVGGRPESYPIPCHGEGGTVKGGHLTAMTRRFKLPKDFF